WHHLCPKVVETNVGMTVAHEAPDPFSGRAWDSPGSKSGV
ncbi:hypothetical protein PENNAL_c0280G07845, partial [Penicillium nalgiovense]